MSSAYRIINALSFSLIFIGYFLFPWKINQGIALVGLGLISWAIFNLRSENIKKWLSDPLTKLILAFLLICIFQTINTPEIWSASASDSISRYYKYIFSILAIAAMNPARKAITPCIAFCNKIICATIFTISESTTQPQRD